jgi:hypothetical protein
MRLVYSSNPGDIDRDTSVRLLAERAVLTRAVCRELLDARGEFSARRPLVAMTFLLQWIQQNCPKSVRIEPGASDGLEEMVIPTGCEELLQEIRDGAQVGMALFMLFTADNSIQARGDEERIRETLAAYWANHATAARAPNMIECLSSIKTNGA